MNINYDLLDKALTAIENEPERWNQSSFVRVNPDEVYAEKPANMCGTTMCLAGHVMLESGNYEVRVKSLARDPYYDKDWVGRSPKVAVLANKETDKEVEDYSETAADLLGIDEELSYTLFYLSVDLTDRGMTPAEFRVWVKDTIAKYEEENNG